MGITGAGTGFILIYVTPLLVHVASYYKHKNKKSIKNDGSEEIMLSNANNQSNTTINSNQISKILIKKNIKVFEVIFFSWIILLIIFGLFTICIQFIYFDFFGVIIVDPFKKL